MRSRVHDMLGIQVVIKMLLVGKKLSKLTV